MRRQTKRGFTLVELLVVITIIGMLAALLLPAIQQAREAGRRATCLNNMKNVGFALINYESSKKAGFPGYVNNALPGGYKRCSWLVTILPLIERTDLYTIWSTRPTNQANTSPIANLPLTVCPSDPATTVGGDSLAYVVNGGAINTDTAFNVSNVDPTKTFEKAANGIFFDQFSDGSANDARGPSVSLDYITTKDGSSNTLLVAENIQTQFWATVDGSPPSSYPGNLMPTDAYHKKNNTFLFLAGKDPQDQTAVTVSNQGNEMIATSTLVSPAYVNAQINNDRDNESISWNDNSINTWIHARPSSRHPGGVNVVFADGHTYFLAEDIAYHVYSQLMTPFGQKSNDQAKRILDGSSY